MEVVNLMNNIDSKFGTLLSFTWGSELYKHFKESYYQYQVCFTYEFYP